MEKKLTAEQITIIEETLVLNGLKFDDLKLELTDHIASEIEEMMNTNMLSFEENLKLVFNKWSEQLRPSYSFWINSNNNLFWFTKTELNPSLVTYKCNKLVKKVLSLSIIIGILISILLTVATRNWHNEIILNYLKSGFRIVCFAIFILFVFVRFRIWKSKHNTTYGYLFKRNGFIQIINLFFLSMGIFPFRIYNGNFSLDLAFNSLSLIILFVSVFYLKVAYNHIQFDKKLSLYNS
ncbi:MAG: hypothetical protein ABI554_14650 [Flavobacterium sp.]